MHCASCATSNINAGEGSFFFFKEVLVFSNNSAIISPLKWRDDGTANLSGYRIVVF